MGTVTNAMADPDFGVYAFGPQGDGQGDTVSFDYFTLDGADSDPCQCVPGPGDEFDGGALDKTKWNAIVREDESQYSSPAARCASRPLAATSTPTATPRRRATSSCRTRLPATGDQIKVSGDISGGYKQGGLLVYVDDDNYIKYDLISDDGQTVKNRIELRSEVNGAIVEPQPQVTGLNADAAWLRLTKTGNSYAGEYSLDGESWQSIGQPVTNNMAAPKFGLFTLGVNSPGATVVFDYFSVNGSTGCTAEPENRPPVINAANASPSIGFGPLNVDFTVDATDADDDPLTYSWDFDGDGTEDSTAEDPSHTYTEPGVYDAEVTVLDGEIGRSRTVPVQVLEPTPPTRASACWSSRRRPASATTRSTRASPRSGRWDRRTSSRSTRPKTPPHSATPCWGTTTPSSSCRRPVIRSMPASRQRSSAISARRRLHRRPLRRRHRVRLELVRPSGRRLLPQPPARNAHRHG